jgi:TonB family protein
MELPAPERSEDKALSVAAPQKSGSEHSREVLASLPDVAASHSQPLGFADSRDAPTLSATIAHSETSGGNDPAESGIPAAAGGSRQSPDPVITPGAPGLEAAYIPSAVNARFAPVNRHAEVPALPAYRSEPSTTGEAFEQHSMTAQSTHTDDFVEIGGALIHRVTPRYPSRARSWGLVDKVLVSIDVDASGNVNSVSVLNRGARPMFQHSVVRAVYQWQFEPLIRNGVPVERTLEQSFEFRLEPVTAKRRSQNCNPDHSTTRGKPCRLMT